MQDQAEGKSGALRAKPFPVEATASGCLLIRDHQRQIFCAACCPGKRFIIRRTNGIKISYIAQRKLRDGFLQFILVHKLIDLTDSAAYCSNRERDKSVRSYTVTVKQNGD